MCAMDTKKICVCNCVCVSVLGATDLVTEPQYEEREITREYGDVPANTTQIRAVVDVDVSSSFRS